MKDFKRSGVLAWRSLFFNSVGKGRIVCLTTPASAEFLPCLIQLRFHLIHGDSPDCLAAHLSRSNMRWGSLRNEILKLMQIGRIPGARIHILVHSMGNRIVMNCLSQLHNAGASKLFGHVVLCAPDVGTDDFGKWAPGVVQVSEKVTLYANAGDSALIVSKGLHSEQRAGDAHSPMIVYGIDTIDCSRIESGLLGHS